MDIKSHQILERGRFSRIALNEFSSVLNEEKDRLTNDLLVLYRSGDIEGVKYIAKVAELNSITMLENKLTRNVKNSESKEREILNDTTK